MLKRLRAQIARAVARLRTLGRRSIPLTICSEAAVLTQADDVFSRTGAVAGSGATSHLIYAEYFPKERLSDWLTGRAGGDPLPDWATGQDGVLRGGVQLSRVSNAWYVPHLGAVIGSKGEVFKSTVAEALYFTPTLAAVPHVRFASPNAPRFYPPKSDNKIHRATVFASWGGLHNYGHFLLDSLPALWISVMKGALQDYPPIGPPLNTWQMDLVNCLLSPGSKLTTVPEEVIQIEDVLFSNTMDHFLHTPNHPLDQIRAEILGKRSTLGQNLPRRIYLTRQSDPKRRMLNELPLQQALEARGFEVINPIAFNVAQQISLFNQADIVISATGAGLANALFAGENTKIFELFPSNFPGIWVRNLCFLLGLDWHGFVSPSPVEERLMTIEGEARPGLDFCWQLLLPEFLTFLDERI